jgi:hypothetical protein
VDFPLEHLEMDSHLLEHLDSWLNHQVVNGFGILETRPHDSLELKTSIDELLSGALEDIREDWTVVNNVEVNPVSLGPDPNFEILVHCFELLNPSNNIVFDVSSKLTHWDDF